jgi:RimJ/RimL family protein N-acetyltransferase
MAIGPIELLITDRLSLEPLRESHADEMVAVLAPLALYEFTGGSPPDRATLAARYRAQSHGPALGDEDWFNWILRSRESAAALGFVQATVLGRRADVAWVVGVDHQGRGLATEAATAVAGWLISNGIESVEAHIHPGHGASQGVARAIGLVGTGVRDEDGEEIWSSDRSDA